MATLPDLNTDGITFIAYWNAIEQGGVDPGNWEASEVTDDTEKQVELDRNVNEATY